MAHDPGIMLELHMIVAQSGTLFRLSCSADKVKSHRALHAPTRSSSALTSVVKGLPGGPTGHPPPSPSFAAPTRRPTSPKRLMKTLPLPLITALSCVFMLSTALFLRCSWPLPQVGDEPVADGLDPSVLYSTGVWRSPSARQPYHSHYRNCGN